MCFLPPPKLEWFSIFNFISSVDFNQCAFTTWYGTSNSRSPPAITQIDANILKLFFENIGETFLRVSRKLDCKLDLGFTDCVVNSPVRNEIQIWKSLLYRQQVILRQWCVQCRIFLWERSLGSVFYHRPSPPRPLHLRIARKHSPNVTLLKLSKNSK